MQRIVEVIDSHLNIFEVYHHWAEIDLEIRRVESISALFYLTKHNLPLVQVISESLMKDINIDIPKCLVRNPGFCVIFSLIDLLINNIVGLWQQRRRYFLKNVRKSLLFLLFVDIEVVSVDIEFLLTADAVYGLMQSADPELSGFLYGRFDENWLIFDCDFVSGVLVDDFVFVFSLLSVSEFTKFCYPGV